MEVGGKSPIFISKVAIEEYIQEYIVGLLFELELIVFLVVTFFVLKNITLINHLRCNWCVFVQSEDIVANILRRTKCHKIISGEEQFLSLTQLSNLVFILLL